MARARNIKPSIMDNEELAELPPLTRILFIYMWMLADREGRLEDRPAKIKKQALGYEENSDVNEWLSLLHDKGFINRYEIAGQKIIQIVNFLKHQSPHGTEKDSDLPDKDGYLTVHKRGKNGCTTGETESIPVVQNNNNSSLNVKAPLTNSEETVKPRPDSLIPDCGIMNPDSGFSDSPIPDSNPPDWFAPDLENPEVEMLPAKKVVREKAPKAEPPTAETWDAYRNAYRSRYGQDPVRNQTINGQLAQFVKRLGGAEAPSVAAFYVGHNNGFYVRSMHVVSAMLHDAESLRTQWATGRQMTQTSATQADKTQTNYNAFAPLLDKAKREEEAKQHGIN